MKERSMMLLAVVLCVALGTWVSVAPAQTKASGYPAAVLEGNWVSDVKMSSKIAKAPKEGYWWVGRMWGRIDETGKLTMRAANGCVFTGVLVDKSNGSLVGEVESSGCSQDSMNRRYRARASGAAVDGRGGAMKLSLRMSQNGGGQGLLDAWAAEGSFVRYQPTN